MGADVTTPTSRPRLRMVILLTLAVLPDGCALGRDLVREEVIWQASFDHRCPPERVKVLQEVTRSLRYIWGYHLDVCGKERRYRLVNHDSLTFLDVTPRS